VRNSGTSRVCLPGVRSSVAGESVLAVESSAKYRLPRYSHARRTGTAAPVRWCGLANAWEAKKNQRDGSGGGASMIICGGAIFGAVWDFDLSR
jgi:hypothetical protein